MKLRHKMVIAAGLVLALFFVGYGFGFIWVGPQGIDLVYKDDAQFCERIYPDPGNSFEQVDMCKQVTLYRGLGGVRGGYAFRGTYTVGNSLSKGGAHLDSSRSWFHVSTQGCEQDAGSIFAPLFMGDCIDAQRLAVMEELFDSYRKLQAERGVEPEI